MRIVYYPDPVLTAPARALVETPADLEQIVAGMREVMQLEQGIGLAAPQVGLSMRLILVNPGGKPEDEIVLINPEITRYYGKKEWGEEGCLSFPGIWGEVLRHKNVEVRFRNGDGETETLEASDLLARVLQHEIDHLDGKLFVHRMRPGDKISNRARLQELRDRFDAART